MSQQLVARVKADLEARGVPTAGACGAFTIIHHVAWALRAQGAGLLIKRTQMGHPDGPQQSPFGCWRGGNLFAVDPIIFPSGEHVDALIDGGGRNEPSWQRVLIEGTDQPFLRPNAYHPVWPPSDASVSEPDGGVEPEPTPTPPAMDVQRLAASIKDLAEGLTQWMTTLDAKLNALSLNDAHLADLHRRSLRGSVFGVPITLTPVDR